MPRIAGASRMRIVPWLTVTVAPRARTCNPAHPREWRNRERPLPHREGPREHRKLEEPRPHPAPSEWAIGRLRRARPTGIGALSAVCAMAPRRGRIATTDIPASARRGAAAGPRAPATGAAAVVLAAAPAKPAAAAAAAALVSIARSER